MSEYIKIKITTPLKKDRELSEKVVSYDRSNSHDRREDRVSSIVDYRELYEYEKSQRLSAEKQVELLKVKLKKILNEKGKPSKCCPQCLEEVKNNDPQEKNLVEELKIFSSKISTVVDRTQSNNFQEIDSALLKSDQKLHEPLIENFVVFGAQEEDMVRIDETQALENVLYSMNEVTDVEKQTPRFVFPTGMAVKKVTGNKAKDKAKEIMSFCYTNLKSFVLIFEQQLGRFDNDTYKKNELLQHLNPEKKLFALCIGVHDYTWLEQNSNKYNISLGEIDSMKSTTSIEKRSKVKSDENPITSMADSNGSINEQIEIAISQRVFCIYSYYPLFTFYEEILRRLINNVKMERLTYYKHNEENIRQTIKQTDSRFQLDRMNELFSECIGEILHKKIQLNRSYELKLVNQDKITLLTDWSYVKSYFIDEWIFSILNMFTLDTFLDLFTLTMLEERLVFVCDHSHILTYTIYLFACILAKPIRYTSPIVTILSDEAFLDTPFTALYGFLKKRKYIESKKIIENYRNTYVFLSPESVEIVYTEDKKDIIRRRSPKLKEKIAPLFKQLKRFRKGDANKSTKYEIETPDYCMMSTLEEREISVEIVRKVNEFMDQEVVKRLPSYQEAQAFLVKVEKSGTLPKDKDIHMYVIQEIAANIKKKLKDPFLHHFLTTQMLSNHLFH